tara:strand:- start:52 stop:549 length:498 start_codon:yes stop_codon:yes gene_type:complete
MQIRVRDTGAVMYEDEFRRLHTGLGLPKVLTEAIINEWGGDIVFEGPQATGGTVYQFSMRQGVEQLDGKWYTKYILGPVFTDRAAEGNQPAQTAAEQETAYKAMKDAEQAKSVRTSRTEKLKDCDWTQIADSTADKTAWATYRQALRDITAQSGFPWTITWPDAP